MAINWNTTKEDKAIIVQIAKRAVKLLGADYIETAMDITAVHVNDTPLRLNDLLNADDFNFAHDVYGIAVHVNKNTGKCIHGFLPRFSGN
jgi:hypothetical protein